METVAISTLMTHVGEVVTAAIGWLENFATIVVDNPLLVTFCIAVPLVGLGVGLLNRLIRI